MLEPIAGGAGDEVLVGTNGDDTIVFEHAGDRVLEKGGENYDTVRASVDFQLPDGAEPLVLMGKAALDGTASADALSGHDGGKGEDRLSDVFGRDDPRRQQR